MNKEIITFSDTEIEKRKFHYSKYPINIKNVDVDKIILSCEDSFVRKGFKYFIGYKDDEKVKLFYMAPKMSRYTKTFDETKYMSFLIKDDELLKKYNKIWDKVSNSIKGFDSEQAYNEKYLET